MRTSFLIVASVLLVSAAASAQSIDDAQIAAIVVTANQVDIDAGTLASRSLRRRWSRITQA
jgi:putative membrane protein